MEKNPADVARENRARLLHRWFVEYNPIYLVSALLVLGGVSLASRGLVDEGKSYSLLGVALVAEVYACALIFGAALLTRIGQRRPAVLLAMITVVYQCDLTLHTETCAYLRELGVFAAIAWLALFVAKLFALAWAVKIRLGARAIATAIVGAFGLAAAPFAVQFFDARPAGIGVALFVFTLGSLCPRAEDSATSRVELDAWGQTVLRRSVRVTWILWAVLLALHGLFLASERPIDLRYVVTAFAFLAVRRVERESHLWTVTCAILGAVFLVAPSAFALCALMSGVTLAHRAFSRVLAIADVPTSSREPSPYRMPECETDARDAPRSTVATLVPRDAKTRARLSSGALFAFYLAAWTLSFRGGAFPAHVLALDLAFAGAVLLLSWRSRSRAPFLPLATTVAHALLTSGLVPVPHSSFAWGSVIVGLGFVLLLGSLATSYRLRRTTRDG